MNKHRTRQVIFRASEDEWKKISAAIQKSGASQQEFLLRAALGKEILCLDDMRELMTELKRQGNNLNQLTRKANQTGWVDSRELETLQKGLEEIWRQLRSYLQKQA